jgi:hypothetical protein
MFGSRRRLTRLAGARLHRNSGNSYRPGCESLETRLVLHGSAWSGAIPIPQAAVDPVAAGAQVLTISQTSIAQFKALQLKLDTLSARLQHQTHSARQATVNHVQTIVQQFVKQENKRYKQVQAIAATVSGSAMFTAVAQFEQGIHLKLLTVKSQVVPAFRQLVNATFTPVSPASRPGGSDVAALSRSVVNDSSAESVTVDRAVEQDASDDNPADELLGNVVPMLGAMGLALLDIANAPDTSCAFTAARSLRVYNGLLNAFQALFNVLAPFASDPAVNAFVNDYNNVVMVYNAAIKQTSRLISEVMITNHG